MENVSPPALISDLNALLAQISPVLDPACYVYITLGAGSDAFSGPCRLRFREAEGETLVITREAAHAAGLAFTYPCRMITLSVASALDAVGFLAAVTTRLASAGISVNPVSAYHHDYLFIAEQDADKAMDMLADLSASKAKDA